MKLPADFASNSLTKNTPLSQLLNADLEELRGDYDRARDIFESCLQPSATQLNITLAWIHYIRFVRRQEGIQAARKLFKRAREDLRVSYHLFVANAYLEYYVTKDKTIGFRIFHLGAKRFGHEPEYMLAFIRFMSCLNEDNNTRVLFERILTTEELPIQRTYEIWSEFLKFECTVGDLASILKVDKKMRKVFESLSDNRMSEVIQSTLMIDRYRYMDLLPCNFNELRSIGYRYIAPNQKASSGKLNLNTLFSSNGPMTSTDQNLTNVNEAKKAKYPTPDITQMLPFKPVRSTYPSVMHPLSGGVFPFPPSVSDLVKRLPPPNVFEGPFVIIDEFLKTFKDIEIKEDFQPLYVYVNGESMKDSDHTSGGHKKTSHGMGPAGGGSSKRNQFSVNSDEDDGKRLKLMDIYKQRQYKRLIQK